ncbi:MAG: hypothetical protein WEG36_12320 [Gemmatimonadota bacterium]
MSDALRHHLASLPAGPVPRDDHALDRLLENAWDQLSGGDGGMEGYKIHNRIFNVTWAPPTLAFEIERHGGIVAGGSGYAEIQSWEVNADTAVASLVSSRKQRVRPMQAAVDTEQLAAELAALILAGEKDGRLRLSGDRVQVKMAAVLPSAAKQTTQGRQKRLNAALGIHLGKRGWVRGPGGWWSPRDPEE